jgi:shikimate kinase
MEKRNIAAIFLVGFMGAGKTTVGRVLAERLKYSFDDLDQLIEKRAGRSIKQIFSELGEAEFRRLETDALRSCRENKKVVIALGGGAYASSVNRDLLREMGRTVLLDCPLEICLARIEGDKSRPLLATKEEMRALLESRLPSYEMADFAVNTAARSPEEIASQIITLLSEKDNLVS